MKPKVFIARPIPQEAIDIVAERCDYRIWDKKEPIPRDLLLAQLADADGLVTFGGRVDREMLAHAPRLKVVSNISVGYNNFDLPEMKRRKVLGTHTPHVLDDTVADMVIALMLAAARRITELDAMVKAGQWQKGADFDLYGVDVHHATLGIIGMGRIGEAVAKRARFGFSMDVLYTNRRRRPDAEQAVGATFVSLPELLRRADFIVVLVPLTEETYHLIGEAQFAAMKDSAIFVNVSRGKTVDEEALYRALSSGAIRAAGLDVFEREPVAPDNPLLRLKNVVTVPHIGSATAKTRLEMAKAAARSVVAGVHGERPLYVVPELQELL
ncbi:MAG TPA: D-glycerate dehydrogenase [Bacilli bacterium]